MDVSLSWAPGETVSGRLAQGLRSPGFLLAHGAGAGQDHPGVAGIRDGLATAGHPVFTFNYPYMEMGRRRPDPGPRLLACHHAALDWFREAVDPAVILAGRSMGGRMATHLAAAGEDCSGLVLFAYPLHPAGRPDRLRVEHLTNIRVPMLFFSGTRDALARPDLVDAHLRTLPGATVEIVEGADHSFRLPKQAGRTLEQVLAGIVERTVDWVERL